MPASLTDRAWNYIATMEPSILGQRGSTALFNVACVLVKGFSLNEEDCRSLIERWNEAHARPVWSSPELRHKLASAARSSRREGYLLDAEPAMPASTRRRVPAALCPTRMPARNHAAERAQVRFQPVTPGDEARIVQLRHASPAIVHAMVNRGMIRTIMQDGHRCWAMMEGTFAQARRYDGGLLPTSHGERKCKTLPRSQGRFFGTSCFHTDHPILMVEGVVGLLEAASLIDHSFAPWLPFAAISASSRFEADPQTLQRFRGRRVRIVPDEGSAGLEAAAHWLAALEPFATQVDIFSLPPGLKDLGPLLKAPEAHAALIAELFQNT
ncbi:MAG: hypothetical protein ACAI34_03325 [Verrucomicrobium sp.]